MPVCRPNRGPNIVGYNTAANDANDTWQFIGASFENIADGDFIPLSAIQCVEGFSDGDQIQVSSVNDKGIVKFKTYEYWDGEGWADPDEMEIIEDDVGFKLGQGAWFISSTGKHITIAGGVKKGNHIHTFTETWSIKVSAFPVAFCPNSANISWGCEDGAQIQTSSVNNKGIVKFKTYEYWDGEGWADPDEMEVLDPDFAVAPAGRGFWFITQDPESASFSEVGPLAE